MTIPDSGFMMENGASCLPHLPEEENRIVTDLMKKSEANLKEGNLYYVLSNRYKGGPALLRKLILQEGVKHQQFNVEVYPLSLNLVDSRDNSQSVVRLSKKTYTVGLESLVTQLVEENAQLLREEAQGQADKNCERQ